MEDTKCEVRNLTGRRRFLQHRAYTGIRMIHGAHRELHGMRAKSSRSSAPMQRPAQRNYEQRVRSFGLCL